MIFASRQGAEGLRHCLRFILRQGINATFPSSFRREAPTHSTNNQTKRSSAELVVVQRSRSEAERRGAEEGRDDNRIAKTKNEQSYIFLPKCVMAPADDPFACFGDPSSPSSSDDDDDNCDDDDHDDDARDRARRLVERYNDDAAASAAHGAPDNRRSLTTTTKHGNDLAAAADAATASSSSISSPEDQAERTSHLPWPSHPPLYLGPGVILTSSLEDEAGGGRGYVASIDLPPGTLILVEEPLVDGWSEGQLGRKLGLESIRHILEGEDKNAVVGCLEELHPRRARVDDVMRRRRGRDDAVAVDDDEDREGSSKDEKGAAAAAASSTTASADALVEAQISNMMSEMECDDDHVAGARSLVSYAKRRSVTNSDGSPLDAIDVKRMLLTMRYNGFDSGLYLHFSMFNHDEGEFCQGGGGGGGGGG